MRKKFNLFLSISAIGLTIILFGFGVYAAVSSNISLTNRITFSPTDIFVDISGVVTGYSTEATSPITYTYVHDENEVKPIPNWDDEALKNLNFINSSTPIVFTFEITSQVDMAFEVEITDYVRNNQYITATPLPKVTFTANDFGETKIIAIAIRVKDPNSVFTNVENNFNVEFRTV